MFLSLHVFSGTYWLENIYVNIHMSCHLPRRPVAAASVLILPDSWEHSALPPAQLCEREDSRALSDDKLASRGLLPIEEPHSGKLFLSRRVLQDEILYEISCAAWISLLFQKLQTNSWTMPEATLRKPFILEHLRHASSTFQQMFVAHKLGIHLWAKSGLVPALWELTVHGNT